LNSQLATSSNGKALEVNGVLDCKTLATPERSAREHGSQN